MKTVLRAAAAAISIMSVGTAFADSGSPPSGYAFPNFWGRPAPQAPNATAPEPAGTPSVGAYATQSAPASRGVYLFPPDPWR